MKLRVPRSDSWEVAGPGMKEPRGPLGSAPPHSATQESRVRRPGSIGALVLGWVTWQACRPLGRTDPASGTRRGQEGLLGGM